MDWAPILDDTVQSLAEALWHYWPANGNNEVGEATSLLHFAHSLARSGFRTYSLVPQHDDSIHIDLFATNPTLQIHVAAEGKRLWNAGKASSLAHDYRRIENFRAPYRHGHAGIGFTSWAVVLATTWKPQIHRWWEAPNRAARPDGATGDGWTLLRDQLGSADICVSRHIYEDSQRYPQSLLFSARRTQQSFSR